MRHNSEWRKRHDYRISNFLYPDKCYYPSQYPSIVPYCAIPNYYSLMNYEIEDIIDKYYRIELSKLMLMKEGYYPRLAKKQEEAVQDNYLEKIQRANKVILEREADRKKKQEQALLIRQNEKNENINLKMDMLFEKRGSNSSKIETKLPPINPKKK